MAVTTRTSLDLDIATFIGPYNLCCSPRLILASTLIVIKLPICKLIVSALVHALKFFGANVCPLSLSFDPALCAHFMVEWTLLMLTMRRNRLLSIIRKSLNLRIGLNKVARADSFHFKNTADIHYLLSFEPFLTCSARNWSLNSELMSSIVRRFLVDEYFLYSSRHSKQMFSIHSISTLPLNNDQYDVAKRSLTFRLLAR